MPREETETTAIIPKASLTDVQRCERTTRCDRYSAARGLEAGATPKADGRTRGVFCFFFIGTRGREEKRSETSQNRRGSSFLE